MSIISIISFISIRYIFIISIDIVSMNGAIGHTEGDSLEWGRARQGFVPDFKIRIRRG